MRSSISSDPSRLTDTQPMAPQSRQWTAGRETRSSSALRSSEKSSLGDSPALGTETTIRLSSLNHPCSCTVARGRSRPPSLRLARLARERRL